MIILSWEVLDFNLLPSQVGNIKIIYSHRLAVMLKHYSLQICPNPFNTVPCKYCKVIYLLLIID